MMTIFRKAGTGYQKDIFGKSSGIFLFEITGYIIYFLEMASDIVFTVRKQADSREKRGLDYQTSRPPVPDLFSQALHLKTPKSPPPPNSTFSWGQNVQTREPIERHVTFRPQI